MTAAESPLNKSASQSVCWNFKLLAHHELGGFGGIGEGMAVQVAKDGRRILWLAHESAPKNFTAVDVSDPRNPRSWCRPICRRASCAPTRWRLSGDIMAVAYQTQKAGQKPAGFELFDISVPRSRNRSAMWMPPGRHRAASTSSGSATARSSTWPPARPISSRTHPKDDQCLSQLRRANPSKPIEVGRWWLPGRRGATTRRRRAAPGAALDSGFRPHNTNVYPERPDRVYIGYLDGGMFVHRHLRQGEPEDGLRSWDNSPPYTGFTHTVVPLFDRNLLIVSDESHRPTAADWPKLMWILDDRDEENPVPISTCPMPPVDVFRAAAAASARTTSTRTRRRHMPGILRTSSSARSSTAACAPTTSTTRTSPRKSRLFRAAGAGAVAVGSMPAQRCLHRRARDRLHRRPLHRRALILEMDF